MSVTPSPPSGRPEPAGYLDPQHAHRARSPDSQVFGWTKIARSRGLSLEQWIVDLLRIVSDPHFHDQGLRAS